MAEADHCRLRVAVVQMDCELDDRSANLEKAFHFVGQAVEEGAKLIVLPELFATGYRTEETDGALAEKIPGPTTRALLGICREKKVFIVGCTIEKAAGGVLYDTAFLVGPHRYLGKYRKIHLWKGEEKRFARGTELQPIRTPIAVIGLQ
ncbi:MAG: carbon-nitrogen hydrolase family protein, partial [bacterium]